MKTYKKQETGKFNFKFKTLFFLIALSSILACSSDDDSGSSDSDLAGAPGNPRFNLQFTNSDNVDLDLFVRTPNGTVVYYGNPVADGGSLDVDCLCFGCPQGPNENIFWQNGTAPTGTYEYWVEYFESCNGDGASSNFTLRLLRNSEVVSTRTGSLSSGQSTVWTHNQN